MPGVHVTILAAGRGSRLGALGDDTPKWLLDVGGRPLADRQLEGIAEAGDAVASLTILTGHAAPVIDAFLAERPEAGARTLFNEDYLRLNNWYSVLMAIDAVEAPDPRIVIINGDFYADAEAFAGFLTACAETDAEALVAVDLERELTDESMKVSLRPGGTLDRIGKVGVDDPAGEYVGMLMASGSVLERFREGLARFVGDPAAANEWYEGAVGRTAAAGADWTIWPMPSTRWVEIDDDGDLQRALVLAPDPA